MDKKSEQEHMRICTEDLGCGKCVMCKAFQEGYAEGSYDSDHKKTIFANVV